MTDLIFGVLAIVLAIVLAAYAAKALLAFLGRLGARLGARRPKMGVRRPMATPKKDIQVVEGRVISFFDGLSEEEIDRLSKPAYLRLDKGELPKGFPFA